jgi:dihydroorotate dehydrogenase electron transfer subunit
MSHVAEASRARGVHQLKVVGQREECPHHFRLTLESAAIARTARPGHFVHILTREEIVTQDPLWRRPFSILRTDESTFDVLYRVVGRGTQQMSRWQAGAVVDVLGPLGIGFPNLAEHSLLVGGGVGVPPLAMLASSKQSQHVVALIGARNEGELLCREDFARNDVPVEVATDDGSAGHHGFVTKLLNSKLQTCSAGAMPTVYSCGPLPMLRTVAGICAQHDVPCYVSLEEVMPCGIGVCNGCVVPVLNAADDYARFKRICVEGPVLNAQEVNWDEVIHSASPPLR